MPRKKTQPQLDQEQSENFVVITPPQSSVSNDEERKFSADDLGNKWIEQAMKDYNIENKQSSVYLDNKGTYMEPTLDLLNQLAESPQDSLSKIQQINGIVARYSNLDDIIGLTIDSIKNNLNTEFRMSYNEVSGRNKGKKADRAKELITDFHDEIKIRRVIADTIPRAYQEGTVIVYLRRDDSGWVLDQYPLGVALLSHYTVSGDPVVLIDMTELKSRLSRNDFKTRKGKNLFYPTLDEIIRANYSDEIYEAFKNKEPYAKLDIRYTGVIRVNNNGHKYGVTPIFRAIPASLILQGIYKSDDTNSKARSKKILAITMDPVILGPDSKINPLDKMAFCHQELLRAYKAAQPGSAVLFTAPPYVKAISFVEPKTDLTDVKNIAYHRNRELSTLGIGFLTLESDASVSSANISLAQLMRNINSISEQLEEVLQKFYRQILIDNELDPSYAPHIRIIDSEAMEFALKKEFATVLYTIFNASLRTSLEILGVDLDDEKVRRQEENDQKIHEIFFGRQTSFNSTGNENTNKDKPGRPEADEETDKNRYDNEYNKNRN